ncbi:MAG: hypothetical protein MZU97_18945 [Bacillus subtilis]|nr:hypothetical protein [Bacillus subtilis]
MAKSGIGESLERITLSNVEIDLDTAPGLRPAGRRPEILADGVRVAGRPGSPRRSPPAGCRIALRDPDRGAAWYRGDPIPGYLLAEREVCIALDGSISGVLSDPRAPIRRITVPGDPEGEFQSRLHRGPIQRREWLPVRMREPLSARDSRFSCATGR